MSLKKSPLHPKFMIRSRRRVRRASLVALTLAALLGMGSAQAANVVVYAAASLTNALGDVAQAYAKDGGNSVDFSFASSSVLARQIAEGAPAAIYVSANVQWMDYVQEHDAIANATREALVANQLALIAPVDSKIDAVTIAPGFALDKLLAGGKLAIANPQHVPAGIYGKEALQSLDVWDTVKDQLVRGSNVRVTLNYVAHGGIGLGIVYATDATVADNVKIVGLFPASSHKPIIYAAALTRQGDKDAAARDFYAFMGSAEAGKIMAQYGFKVLD